MIPKIAKGNFNQEPTRTDIGMQLLKLTAGTAAIFTGAAFLSTLGIFKGIHFQTPGLSPEQTEQMDQHNLHHQQQAELASFGLGLNGGEAVKLVKDRHAAEVNEILDNDTRDLPGKLAHKHS